MRFALCLCLALVLCGCTATPPAVSVVEAEIFPTVKTEFARVGAATPISVSLVDADGKGHQYDGIVEMPDGSKVMIKVTRQDNGEMIWRSVD